MEKLNQKFDAVIVYDLGAAALDGGHVGQNCDDLEGGGRNSKGERTWEASMCN